MLHKIIIPQININGHEFEDLSVEYNSLNLIAGANGTGKSLMNIMMFYSTHLYTTYGMIQSALGNPIITKQTVVQYGNEVLDSVFGDATTIHGRYTLAYTDGNITLKFKDDKLYDIVIDGALTNVKPITYITGSVNHMRELKAYRRLRQSLGIPNNSALNIGTILRLSKEYRLYDLLYLEQLLDQINTMEINVVYPLDANTELLAEIGDGIMYDGDDIHVINGVKAQRLSSMSKGVNSIVLLIAMNKTYGKPKPFNGHVYKIVVDSKGVANVVYYDYYSLNTGDKV